MNDQHERDNQIKLISSLNIRHTNNKRVQNLNTSSCQFEQNNKKILLGSLFMTNKLYAEHRYTQYKKKVQTKTHDRPPLSLVFLHFPLQTMFTWTLHFGLILFIAYLNPYLYHLCIHDKILFVYYTRSQWWHWFF